MKKYQRPPTCCPKVEEEKKDEEEVPSTAVEKKRPSSDVEGSEGPPAKKLCTEEGETSIVPCEVVPLLITISLIKPDDNRQNMNQL